MKTIGIVGSRRRNSDEDLEKVAEIFFSGIYQKGDRICSGGCPKGADRFAEIIALSLKDPSNYFGDKDLEFIVHKPDKSKLDPILIKKSEGCIC